MSVTSLASLEIVVIRFYAPRRLKAPRVMPKRRPFLKPATTLMPPMHESLREAFTHGAHLFDQGAFFEAHEVWEERWRVETDETSRRLLQGLIQIAAGLHKFVAVRDRPSASRLLAKGLAKLDGCAEVAEFRVGMVACAKALALGHLDPSTIPRLGA